MNGAVPEAAHFVCLTGTLARGYVSQRNLGSRLSCNLDCSLLDQSY